MTDEIIPDFDPWDERDAFLEEGHDEAETGFTVIVPAEDGDEPDLSQHGDLNQKGSDSRE